METPSRPTLLIIDDEAQVRALFQTALEESGYRVVSAPNGKAGLRFLQEERVDLVLVDIFMPDMDGLEFITLLHKSRPDCRIIAMSGGTGNWDYLDIAKRLGAHDTLKKPLELQDLVRAISAQLNA